MIKLTVSQTRTAFLLIPSKTKDFEEQPLHTTGKD